MPSTFKIRDMFQELINMNLSFMLILTITTESYSKNILQNSLLCILIQIKESHGILDAHMRRLTKNELLVLSHGEQPYFCRSLNNSVCSVIIMYK